ncbi:hypothetical protein DFA_12169 [Cavenderia fasciculata]|uniref:Uncharacterized protein n=1 Tax=Cavenderia fasciculata TaxID=261658 RepID=F4QCB6_CACFS|nr:uncharacterized protein DFA_12169 [Cavenderia fasciculata]EGG14397.1 hypothetical protein DFA_12169 [Cavenderia fasciculata]|eukprot:XP_004353806.1 hypothetical protein DFA_12169 [Cavenderia fasciculata]
MTVPYNALYTIIGIKGSSPGSAMEMDSEIKSKLVMGSFFRALSDYLTNNFNGRFNIWKN